MRRKNSEIVFVIVALIGAGFLSFTYIEHPANPYTKVNNSTEVVVPSITSPRSPIKSSEEKLALSKVINNSVPQVEIVFTPKEVFAPEPLRAADTDNAVSGELSVHGVIKYTNIARSLNGGLSALAENKKLNLNAKMKLDDMFAKQYFEHVSSSGVGPSGLAKAVGYAYITIGENLALGNYRSDAKLVDAWMNSPAHRVNILNIHYQEIGVAVGKGIYKGDEVWIAVQSFGLPLSACPTIDANLHAQIDENNIQIANLRTELDAKKMQLENTPTDNLDYNIYVTEYNTLVKPYNALVEKTKVLIAEYNAQIQIFNKCAKME